MVDDALSRAASVPDVVSTEERDHLERLDCGQRCKGRLTVDDVDLLRDHVRGERQRGEQRAGLRCERRA